MEDRLIEICTQYGAYKACIIDTELIPFDSELRKYCEANHCGKYGKNYVCPPYIGDCDSVIAKAKSYKKALIFQTVYNIEDSFDYEGMIEASVSHANVANNISLEFEKTYKSYLQLTAGGCNVCPVCAKVSNEPCRFPEKAISSLEAYCMNVVTLAKICDMKYINGKNTVTYFGAFLYNV